VRIPPLFWLYDYNFWPRDVQIERAFAWTADAGPQRSDESFCIRIHIPIALFRFDSGAGAAMYAERAVAIAAR
jgi:hypothetical protein